MLVNKKLKKVFFSTILIFSILILLNCKEEDFKIDFDTPYVWVVGDSTLMCSKDAGLTWINIIQEKAIDLYENPTPRFRSIYFYNTTSGYITASKTDIFYYQTSNAYEWGAGPSPYYGINFNYGYSVGFAAPENRNFFYISDYCFTKNKRKFYEKYNEIRVESESKEKRFWRTKLKSMIFPNEAQGWILGDSTPYNSNIVIPVLLTTLDSAKTWTKTTFVSPSIKTMATSEIPNGFIKWAVGANGTILKSPYLSSTWSQVPSSVTDSLYSIHFQSVDTGYITGCNGLILRTNNQGLTWEKLTTNTTETITSISFMNNKVGIAVGKKGTIIKTNDGGDIWETLTLGTMTNLYDVTFCKRKVFNPIN